MKLLNFLSLALIFLMGCSSHKYERVFKVYAGGQSMVNTPVYVELDRNEFDDNALICLYSKHATVPAQVETLAGSWQRIWWIVNLNAGDSANYELRLSDKCHTSQFQWKNVGEYSSRLSFW